mgnify:FL=1
MSDSKILAEKQDGIGRMIFNNSERHNDVSLFFGVMQLIRSIFKKI